MTKPIECGFCREEFIPAKARSDALAEEQDLFGFHDPAGAIVCDDCWPDLLRRIEAMGGVEAVVAAATGAAGRGRWS